MKRIAMLGLMMAGCAPVVRNTPPPVPGSGAAAAAPEPACRTEALANLIGKPVTVQLTLDAMKKTGTRNTRVVGPDTVVTMDYRPDRLNIEAGPDNRVVRFRCG